MSSWFAHPWWLASILLVIAVLVAYVVIMRRRKKRALRFGNLDLLRSVQKTRRDRFVHVPFAVLLVGLLLLAIAAAGPVAMRNEPRDRATVMLVVDVSNSMASTDVAPTRLKAAQSAGKQFADELTEGVNLGLVSFAGTASPLVPPTPNHSATATALDNLKLDDKTATGEGMFAALDQVKTLNAVLGGDKGAPPAHIVLLSDGKETVPDDPDDPRGAFTAARKAKERGIPVSTISFGTDTGTVEIPRSDGDGDVRVPVPVDDASLKKIADLSGGKFYTAASLAELNQVYENLQQQIGYERVRGDNSRPWMLAGALLVAIGTLGALLLNRRVP